MNIELIKEIIKGTSVVVGIFIYIFIWVSLFTNWDKCMHNQKYYVSREDAMAVFYRIWIILHIIGFITVSMWAWGVL